MVRGRGFLTETPRTNQPFTVTGSEYLRSSFSIAINSAPNENMRATMLRFIDLGYQSIQADAIVEIEKEALATLTNQEYFHAVNTKLRSKSQAVLKKLSYLDHIKKIIGFFTGDAVVQILSLIHI